MESEYLPPNQQLLNAREEACQTREDVAAALNLTVYTLTLLENGRYDQLHGSAYVIGYMRAYAKLFRLDEDALIAAYRSEIKQQVDDAEAKSVDELALYRQKKLRARLGVAAALVVAVGVGYFTATPVIDMASDSRIAVKTAVGTTVINSVDELPDENPTRDMLPQVVWQQEVSPAQVEQMLKQRILGDKLTADSIAVNSSSSLSFQFSADCWVEILDGDHKLIYSSLQKAQERLELSGKPPFRITLGYAPGVSLSYNGQPVNIDANNANIAKLVLGNS